MKKDFQFLIKTVTLYHSHFVGGQGFILILFEKSRFLFFGQEESVWFKVFKKPLINISALVFILLSSSYGYGQSVGCKVSQAFCNSKFVNPQPNCFATKVDCPDPKNPSQSIKGYVPSSTKINYIEVDVTAPNGDSQLVTIPVRGELADVNDETLHNTSVLMYLVSNGYMQDSPKLSLIGAGISTDTKFGNTAGEVIAVSGSSLSYQDVDIKPSAGTLAQALNSGGTSSSTWTCNYTNQPVVIDMSCDKNCPANARCPISNNKKQFCVGSAECKTNTGYVSIRHVFCQADSCPTNVMECMLDSSVNSYKVEEVVPHWTGNNVQRSIGSGATQ